MDLTHGSCTLQSDSRLPPWLPLTLSPRPGLFSESPGPFHCLHTWSMQRPHQEPLREGGGERREVQRRGPPTPTLPQKHEAQPPTHAAHSTGPSCPASSSGLVCTCTLAPSSLSLPGGWRRSHELTHDHLSARRESAEHLVRAQALEPDCLA